MQVNTIQNTKVPSSEKIFRSARRPKGGKQNLNDPEEKFHPLAVLDAGETEQIFLLIRFLFTK